MCLIRFRFALLDVHCAIRNAIRRPEEARQLRKHTYSPVLLLLATAAATSAVYGQQARVTWRVRTLVGDQRLMQWRTGSAAAAFPQLTFAEAAAETDALGLNVIEGSNAQIASPEIQK